MSNGRWIVISDLQGPYENTKALPFVKRLKKYYNVADDHMLCAGDELDCMNGGMYPKDPDNPHSAVHEIKAAREMIKQWVDAFPLMKVAISNHGLRWVKKASLAEIPSQLLRSYHDIFQIPDTWVYKDKWIIPSKHPFMMIHGIGYSGQFSHRTAALDMGMSLVHGHLTHAGISHIKTANQNIWGMSVSCMIDIQAYAFKYGKDHRFKPCLGTGIIVDHGKTPIWLPLE